MSDEVPDALGGYTLIERIGAGGMGEVWRAERITAGDVRRRAAVKRILPQYQRDPALRERFVAEARNNSRIEHPNVVQVLGFGDMPELYLVLEYVEGISLQDVLSRAATIGGGIPVTAALHLIAEAATGLDHAHRVTDSNGNMLGIVHRDVSPSNMLISIDGSVKVNDFGVAKAADNLYRTAAGLSVGKLVYMAPEQAQGEALDHRADVFSLGIVLWELLTLRALLPRNDPAGAITALHHCDFPKPSSIEPSVPPAVDAIVMEALARDPSKRTASAGRMAKSLRTTLHGIAPGYDARDLVMVVRDLVPAFALQGSRAPLTNLAADGPPMARESPAPREYIPVAQTPMAGHSLPGDATVPDLVSGIPATNVHSNAGGGVVPQPAPPAFRAAMASPPAPRVRSARWVIPGIALAILVLVLAGVGFVLLSNLPDEDAAPVSHANTTQASVAQGPSAVDQTELMLNRALIAIVPGCVASAGTSDLHGTVTVDASFQANGTPAHVTVRVNDMSEVCIPVARCIESAVGLLATVSSPSGVTSPSIAIPF